MDPNINNSLIQPTLSSEDDQYDTDDDSVRKASKTSTTSTKKVKRKCVFRNSWLKDIDCNGDNVSTYLRKIENQPTKCQCAADSTILEISNRGWTAIKDHISKDKHKKAMNTIRDQGGAITTYQEKHLADDRARTKAEMTLLTYATVHNLSFDHVDHLIKSAKIVFPDSKIAQSCRLGKTSATYHLKHGLAKTELEFMTDAMTKNPFSVSMDGGTKGNTKRTEINVRFWSQKNSSIVESFFYAEKTNHETAEIVANVLLNEMKSRKIPLVNMVMLHTDSSSVNRGVRNGVLKRISKEVPTVISCDIGGDGLHHIHNASKMPCKKVFPDVVRFLSNIKYELKASPKKLKST